MAAAPAEPPPLAIPPEPAPAPAPTLARPVAPPAAAPAGETAAIASPPTEPVAPPPEEPAAPAAAGNSVTVRMDWKDPTAAAVFRRAGHLWAVFDRSADQDLAAIRAAGRGVLQAVEQIPANKATLLRARTVAGVNPSLRRDGSAWLLDFLKQPLAAQTALDPEVEIDPTRGGRVRLAVVGAGEPVTMVDPEVGDRLVVVPVLPPAHGVGRDYDYPEFSLLATAQGIVVVPRIDDLKVRSTKDAVEITSERGLSVSPVPKAVRDRSLLRPATEPSRLLGLDRWQDLPTAAVVDRKRSLFHAAATADGAAKQSARLALAEFLLSQGLASDGLGVVEVIAADRPQASGEPRLRLLKGATLTMLGRTGEAAAELRHPGLDGNDEGQLWRLAADAGKEASQADAVEVMRRSATIVFSYPIALRIPLALMLSEAAIGGGDPRLARRLLDVLAAEPLDDRQRAALAYLEGRVLEESGEFAEAAARWAAVEDGADRSSRARAALARVELGLGQGELTAAQAIDRLERMRFAWRGDDHEFRLLRLLARLYLEQGEYPRGLRTLRQVVTHFPDHPEIPEVTRQMADAFANLFQGGAAEALPPLSAIALFEEFRELTPTGAGGDELIRRLADRLVSVDLLNQAAAVLEDQVAHRLQGTDKARVEARLALVRLLDRNPEAALAVLSAETGDDLPEPLRQQRLQLTARALTDLGRFDEALAALGDDASPDTELLRAEVHWKRQDWRAAGKALARVIESSGGRPGQPLDETQARHVLNRAVALSLGGDRHGLNRLNDRFGPAMDATPYRDAFRLIARPSASAAGNLHGRVRDGVGDAEGFQSFLAAYRDRLQAGGLSGIN
jgi:tetratricopeptide (TPR) repeat protein